MLTEAELDHYREDGFVVPDFRLPEKTIDAIRADHTRLITQRPAFRQYWPVRPVATCSVWIAVDDSTPENGCLQVIRGSHKSRRLLRHGLNTSQNLTLNQELDPSEYDEGDAIDIVLEAGQISLHDVYLVHRSRPNTSPKPRRR